MGKIPGWEPITPEQLKDVPGAQQVNTQWYMPLYGGDSLQILWDDYLRALEVIWETYSCVRGDERVGIISDAREAGAILKAWGKLDEKGHWKEKVDR